MTEPDLAAIAAGLTEAQREALLNEVQWRGSGETQFAVTNFTQLPANLVTMLTLRWDRLTPLGLALRQHLRETGK